MRLVGAFRRWLFAALVLVPCLAFGQLVPAPASVAFQDIATGTSSSPINLLLISDLLDGGPRVMTMRWKQGGLGFNAVLSRSLPTSVHRPTPLGISLTFKPPTSGKFSDILELAFEQRGITQYVSVPVSGGTTCTEADDDCEPIRPICMIDKNKDKWIEQGVQNLSETVFDALIVHSKLHAESIQNYKLPGSFFYEVLGLSKLFAQPNMCCACGGPGCLPPIEFTKVKGQPTVARFRWPIGTDTTVKSIANPLSIEAMISLPAEVRGKAVVRAGSIEYIFSNSARPSLQYKLEGTVWFDGPLKCIAPGSEVVLRHGRPTGQIPSKHLIFKSTR